MSAEGSAMDVARSRSGGGAPQPGVDPDAGAVAAPTEAPATMARNATHLILGQVGSTALAVLLSATLGRSLGAAEFGLYFLFLSTSTFAFVVVEWGQGQFLIREVARMPERAGAFLAASLAMRAAGGAAAALITAGGTALLGYDRRTCTLATLTVVALLPAFLAQAFGTVFRGRERMQYDALVSVLNKLLALVLTIAAVLLRLGLPGVIAAQAVAGVGALGAAALLSRRIGVARASATLAVARELLVGGTPIVAMTLAIAAHDYIAAVILSKLSPDEVVGWYGAAKNIIGTLIAPATILGSAAFPRLSRAAKDAALLRVEIHAALRPVLLLGGLAGVGTYLFADAAVAIVYGGKFAPAGTILKVFAPGLFLLFVDVLFGAIVVAAGRAAALALAKVVNVGLSTALALLLVPYFQRHHGNGGVGAVLSFALSEVVMFASAALVVPRGALDARMFMDVGRAVVAAAATLALVVFLPTGNPFIHLGLAVMVFTALAFALRLVSRSDVEQLIRIARRRA